MRRLGSFLTQLAMRSEQSVFDDAFAEASGQPHLKQIKKWSEAELHERIAGGKLHAAQKSMAEQELKRRYDWQSPSGWSLWVSIGAFILSAIALWKVS